MTRAALAWRGAFAAAAALAAIAVANWLWAVALRGPVLYGEGAVAHAALLARDRLEYMVGASVDGGGTLRPIFTAANYPPLYFHLAAAGDDPFVTGRVLSVIATLFVAAAVAWRARPAGRLVAGTIALGWLASVPVLQWGAAVKPDLVALAFTVGAVVALDRSHPRHAVAGALMGIAAMAKPTALLPAIAMFVFVARRDPLGAVRALATGVAASLAVAAVTHGPSRLAVVHIFDWNALPWHPELAASLVLIALIVLAVPIVTILVTRPSTTIVTAYAAGAVGILLLGGREGATVNYFLDLSAALALAVAGRAARLRLSAVYPLAAVGQCVIGIALLNPFVGVPSILQPTGKWGDASRIAYVRDFVPGTALVEDSGLLVANGREPVVDDLFLWSRVYAMGGSFLEGRRLLDAVRAARFDAIVSEVDLERMDSAAGFERQRWHPDLVAAVLERYERRPPITEGLCRWGVWCQRMYVYSPR